MSPSSSEKQRKFMGAELGRLHEGKKTKTGMSEEQLKHFASKPIKKEEDARVPVPVRPKKVEIEEEVEKDTRDLPDNWWERRDMKRWNVQKSIDSFLKKAESNLIAPKNPYLRTYKVLVHPKVGVPYMATRRKKMSDLENLQYAKKFLLTLPDEEDFTSGKTDTLRSKIGLAVARYASFKGDIWQKLFSNTLKMEQMLDKAEQAKALLKDSINIVNDEAERLGAEPLNKGEQQMSKKLQKSLGRLINDLQKAGPSGMTDPTYEASRPGESDMMKKSKNKSKRSLKKSNTPLKKIAPLVAAGIGAAIPGVAEGASRSMERGNAKAQDFVFGKSRDDAMKSVSKAINLIKAECEKNMEGLENIESLDPDKFDKKFPLAGTAIGAGLGSLFGNPIAGAAIGGGLQAVIDKRREAKAAKTPATPTTPVAPKVKAKKDPKVMPDEFSMSADVQKGLGGALLGGGIGSLVGHPLAGAAIGFGAEPLAEKLLDKAMDNCTSIQKEDGDIDYEELGRAFLEAFKEAVNSPEMQKIDPEWLTQSNEAIRSYRSKPEHADQSMTEDQAKQEGFSQMTQKSIAVTPGSKFEPKARTPETDEGGESEVGSHPMNANVKDLSSKSNTLVTG